MKTSGIAALLLLAMPVLVACACAQNLVYSLPPVPNPGYTGGLLLGDLSGDGIADYATLPVGCPDLTKRHGVDGTVIGSFSAMLASSFDAAGDVNGDGFDDILLFVASGNRVVSGYSGAPLLFLPNGPLNPMAIGDVNGDGFDDIGYGIPIGSPVPTPGSGVEAISGLDGSVLWSSFTNVADPAPHFFGPAGDVNLDGYADVWMATIGASPTGRVRLISGQDGSSLGTLFHPAAAPASYAFAYKVAGGEDVDGDGRADVAVHAIPATFVLSVSSFIYVFSGATGSLIRTTAVPVNWLGFSRANSLTMIGDTNGDGRSEIAFTIGHATEAVQIIDGLTGTITPLGGYFSSSPSAGGDVTGDGVRDIAVLEGSPDPTILGTPIITLFSPAPLPSASHAVHSSGCGPFLSLSAEPVLDTSLSVLLSAAPPGAAGTLFAGPPSPAIPIGLNCPLHLDPFLAIPLTSLSAGFFGAWAFPVNLPRNARLAGTTFTLQAVIASSPLVLTSALDLTFGY